MRQTCLFASASRRAFENSVPSVSRTKHLYLEPGHRSFSVNADRYLYNRRNGTSLVTSASGPPVPGPSAFHSIYARTFSSNPSQDTSTTPSKPDPLSTSASKKQKVELRPGPIKSETSSSTSTGKKAAASPSPTSTTQPPTSVSASISSSVKSTLKPSTSFRKEVLKEAESKSIIDQTKDDIEDGARHGILAPPPADAGMARRLFHQAKELFKFYWAGLKYIRSHREEAKRIQNRVSTGGAPLTWREHKFIMTNNADMVKVVPFVLIALILEEVIPLIVMYVPGMLPSTCVLPSQKLRIEAKRHERQREAHELVKSTRAFDDIDAQSLTLKSLNADKVTHLCNVVGISTWGIPPMQRRRLRKTLIRLAEEDKLLLGEGSGARLRQDEISSALVDRGFLADQYSPSEERDRLRWWLDNLAPAADSTSELAPEDARVRLLVHMLRSQ